MVPDLVSIAVLVAFAEDNRRVVGRHLVRLKQIGIPRRGGAFTRFNAGLLIKRKKASRQVAQRSWASWRWAC